MIAVVTRARGKFNLTFLIIIGHLLIAGLIRPPKQTDFKFQKYS